MTSNGFLDLQHVVSAAYAAPAPFGRSELAGRGVEAIQLFTHPNSAFRPEDLFSNAIGQEAANIQRESGFQKSISDSVMEALADSTLFSFGDALSILHNFGGCPG